MNRKWLRGLLLIMVVAFMAGCAAKEISRLQQTVEPMKLDAGQYAPKVDNFVIIFDASLSMIDTVGGETKLDIAKRTLSLMNQTLPALGFSGGLRTFGQGACLPNENSSLLWGMKIYSKAELEDAIKTVRCAGGNTPMESALNAAGKDLASTQGKIAVLVVSDGIVLDSLPLRAAQDLKAQLGERLCIYTILVGDHSGGRALMDELVKIGRCGFSVNADSIASGPNMAAFVEKVFLTKSKKVGKSPAPPKRFDRDGDGVFDDEDQCPDTPKGTAVDAHGCPPDTDRDGVNDDLDKCPKTPKNVKVDVKGCPPDTDGDGVYDYLDDCPGTPKGAKVDSRGCWVLADVKFETAKWEIKSQSFASLNEVLNVLHKNPNMKVEVQGHSDNVGRADYNQKLSEKRAEAVRAYLVSKGIEKGQLSAKGYGMTKPAASNAYPEGRAKNRRVELKPIQ